MKKQKQMNNLTLKVIVEFGKKFKKILKTKNKKRNEV